MDSRRSVGMSQVDMFLQSKQQKCPASCSVQLEAQHQQAVAAGAKRVIGVATHKCLFRRKHALSPVAGVLEQAMGL